MKPPFLIRFLTPPVTHRKAEFSCSCGKSFTARVDSVKSGTTKSCGCAKKLRPYPRKHGHNLQGKRTATYRCWANLLSRCLNKKTTQYKDYGGRGIQVCEKWRTFLGFLEDMGGQPRGFQIDRIDNDGNYCKENCRWVTRKENMNNRTDSVRVVFKNEKYTVENLAKILGINPATLLWRFHNNVKETSYDKKSRLGNEDFYA